MFPFRETLWEKKLTETLFYSKTTAIHLLAHNLSMVYITIGQNPSPVSCLIKRFRMGRWDREGRDYNSARLLPRTKHAAVINQVAPCNCPVPAGDDGNMPEVPSHPKLGVAEESVTSSTDREIVPSRDPNKNVKTRGGEPCRIFWPVPTFWRFCCTLW